uniref:Uncharacterized protein n=1 Tax=Sipha flava TaxID=143950 RepID=A0A2S2Q3V0_9HEMI
MVEVFFSERLTVIELVLFYHKIWTGWSLRIHPDNVGAYVTSLSTRRTRTVRSQHKRVKYNKGKKSMRLLRFSEHHVVSCFRYNRKCYVIIKSLSERFARRSFGHSTSPDSAHTPAHT